MTRTINVELTDDIGAKLDRLERLTNRHAARLAELAISDYAERELATIEGIERGLADMRGGRTVPHDEAMRRLRATIERAANGS